MKDEVKQGPPAANGAPDAAPDAAPWVNSKPGMGG